MITFLLNGFNEQYLGTHGGRTMKRKEGVGIRPGVGNPHMGNPLREDWQQFCFLFSPKRVKRYYLCKDVFTWQLLFCLRICDGARSCSDLLFRISFSSSTVAMLYINKHSENIIQKELWCHDTHGTTRSTEYIINKYFKMLYYSSS